VGALNRREDEQLTRSGRRRRSLRTRMPRVPNRLVLTRSVVSHWLLCLHRAGNWISHVATPVPPVPSSSQVLVEVVGESLVCSSPTTFLPPNLHTISQTTHASHANGITLFDLRPFMRVTFGASQSWGHACSAPPPIPVWETNRTLAL